MEIIYFFIISMFIPFILLRVVIGRLSKRVLAMHPFVRNERKFHHFHFGMGFLLVGIIGFLTYEVNAFTAAIAGFGLGMMLDQFMVSLKLPEPEPEMTIIYLKSMKVTGGILLGISILVLCIGILMHRV